MPRQRGGADLALIRAVVRGAAAAARLLQHVVDPAAEEQEVHDARDAPVVGLEGPRAGGAHLRAVLLRGLPVGDESDGGAEGAHVDAAAEVDEGEALGGPAVGAGGRVGGGPVGVGEGGQAHEAVVRFEVAVHEAVGVQGVDGAEQLDGEEEGEGLVEGGDGGGGRGAGVDGGEEGALWVVGFEQVAFVGEEVQGVWAEEGVGGAVGGEARVGGGHDVEFPGCGGVFGFDCDLGGGVGGDGGEIDRGEGAFAELACDGVGDGGLGREGKGGRHGEIGGGLVSGIFGDFGERFDEFTELGSFGTVLGAVIVEAGQRREGRLDILEDGVANGVVHWIALRVFDDRALGGFCCCS